MPPSKTRHRSLADLEAHCVQLQQLQRQLVRSPLSLLCFSLCRSVQADGGWRAVCYGAPTSERKKGERGCELLAVRLRGLPPPLPLVL